MEAVVDKKADLMSKYEAYKDSGVPWLGELPQHWGFLANKFIFRLRKNLVGKRSKEYTLLSLTLNGIIIRDMENPQGKFPAEFDTYQEVKEGDFVFCLFDVEETPRTVGLSNFEGMITGAYTVMEVSPTYNKKYLFYFYLNLDAHKKLKPLYTGLRNTISKENFFSFKTFCPPLSEQTAIANFLDQKIEQIDKAIAQKERQMELLKERQQILIHKAVTRGLDRNVKLKDSGVEWIGEIPEHWEVKFNRRLFRENSRKITNSYELPLSLSQVDGVIPSEEMRERSLSPSHRNNFKLCLPGDLIVNRFKGHLGVFFESSYRGIVTFHYGVFEPLKEVNSKYFEILFHTENYKTIYAGASNGMTVGLQNLSNQNFYNVKSIVPPLLEQKEIISYYEGLQLEYNKSISVEQKTIEKLKEYKATLINSAVTGKIRVG
ncbi:restriction endonuclease subunit S [Mucilaginibacter sp. RS28]|uniref:Restriction endonuclease subunit S n=1 Tax=Mucilaginibacter straminoryzae TaxID=2932774 RepID=A0A9X1X5F7_9SPHI|nr:restriction endonuclease subunit S [Mucilaginibacter straminoryzae]MCJ8209938.1 restriction endonuclease subunit S [Mucilaginibacter straminoryzae]